MNKIDGLQTDRTLEHRRPLSVDGIVAMLKAGGDQRSVAALRMSIIRAIRDGGLTGAFKANPECITSPWLIPAESVARWLTLGQKAKK